MWNLSVWREDFSYLEKRICLHGKLGFVNFFSKQKGVLHKQVKNGSLGGETGKTTPQISVLYQNLTKI